VKEGKASVLMLQQISRFYLSFYYSFFGSVIILCGQFKIVPYHKLLIG